ncbi:MAG: radical SAM protein [Fervidicoccaceae archaeon]
MVLRVTILDGYTDEPAGLGVPPYIDVYPRYAAGAIWYHDKQAVIRYFTIDEARSKWAEFYRSASESQLTLIIAGVVVPGKYLGGTPISPREIINVGLTLASLPTKSILAGPAAMFGMGIEGGSVAYHPKDLGKHYDFVVKGDIDVFLHNMLSLGEEHANPLERRRSYDMTDKFAVLGAKIATQHPNYRYNLMVELETYRGCSRWFTGGCSFCVEPLYGKPISRNPENVLLEIRELYMLGVRGFRFGRQADFLVYGANLEKGDEYPKPNVTFMEHFLKHARQIAPDALIHIDNVNPATIAKNQEESTKVLQMTAYYLSPGNVAALGLESADEKVIRTNNLNTTPEESLLAIEIINRVGGERGENGLPRLLPGINFVLGLPGETKETYYKNIEFLEMLKKKKLMVRRINIRKVLVLPFTKLSLIWNEKILVKHDEYAKWFTWKVRHDYDPFFLSIVAPKGTILRNVYVEKTEDNLTYARQMGSYPITIEIPKKIEKPCILDIRVLRHKGRSVIGEPVTHCSKAG